MINDILEKMGADGTFDRINNMHAINDFFKLPAPDRVIKNAFIHDVETDNAIDCNIYHPKYGYPGFVTDHDDVRAQGIEVIDEKGNKDIEARFFNIRYSFYGKFVHCNFAHTCLCEHGENISIDENDEIEYKELTNKDGVKVKFVDFTLHNQIRNVENESDFELIIQREYKKANLDDTPEAIEAFKKALVNRVENLIQLHQTNCDYNEGIDFNIIGLATRFKNYVLKSGFSHREVIFANQFKAKAGYENEKNAAEWKEERGEKARQQYYTTVYSKNSKNYKAITIQELQQVIKLLAGYPKAEQLAVNKLDNLINS
ncbi:MAG: hypothetical protein BGN92_09765 [Sphingobacteriales bacterium 41-5]|nr:MAG: hypothetical protein BGN92_09765 [Sphingobacteriales bacterium 41-5]